MIDLITAERYKISNSKTLRTVLIAIFLFSAVFGVLLMSSGTLELYYGMKEQGQYAPYLVASNSVFISIALCIFVGFYVGEELDKGIVRNVISTGKSRIKYYLTKLLALMIPCILLTVLTTISMIVVFTLADGWGDTPTLQYSGEILRLLALQIILYFTYASVFVTIAFINRNIGGTIGICIVIVLAENILAQMFAEIEIPILNSIIKSLPLTLLTKLGSTYPYSTPLTTETYISMLFVAIILICSSSLIGIINFKKRDI